MSTKLQEQQKKQLFYFNITIVSFQRPTGLFLLKKPGFFTETRLSKTFYVRYSIPSIGLWSGLLKYCIATSVMMAPPKLPISTIARKAIRADKS